MTTTDTKTEYVTDVEHAPDCKRDRSQLCLVREVIQVMTPEFLEDEDGKYISGDGYWEYEDSDPVKLVCNSCEAKRYVVIDKQGNVIALTRDNCPRYSQAYGHFDNFDRKSCQYCGYVNKRGVL